MVLTFRKMLIYGSMTYWVLMLRSCMKMKKRDEIGQFVNVNQRRKNQENSIRFGRKDLMVLVSSTCKHGEVSFVSPLYTQQPCKLKSNISLPERSGLGL